MRFDDRIATITAQGSDDPRARAAMWRQMVDILAQQKTRDFSSMSRASAFAFLEEAREIVDPLGRRAIAHALSGRHLPIDILLFFAADRPDVAAPLLLSVKLSADEWQEVVAAISPVARSLVRQRPDLDEAIKRQLNAYGASDLMLRDQRDMGTALDLGGMEMAEVPLPVPAPSPVEPVAPEISAPEYVAPEMMASAAPATPAASFLSAPRAVQIRELVDRIEEFRERRRSEPFVPLPRGDHEDEDQDAGAEIEAQIAAKVTEAKNKVQADQLRHFRFEADQDGVILWVDALERTPLIGLNLAEAAAIMGFGVDGHVAGAIARRSAFRDGRLLVAGKSRVGGQWCISGVPLFDESTGRFQGCRGTARRPYPHESTADMFEASTSAAPVGGPVQAVDDNEQVQRLRELVHELRTPLNAISGFADMIRSQFFGPVPHQYREQAETIIASGAELTQILEDLALLVHGPVQRFGQTVAVTEDEAGVDGGDVLRRVLAAHQGQADARQLTLQVEIGRGLPPLAVGEQVLERVLSRLIGNLIELCHQGENISIDFLCLPRMDGSGCVSISRPGKLLGISAEELFDPDRARDDQGMDAARLSLGFTLHLLRNVARQFGGDLDIAEHDFLLLIPAVMSEHQIRFP